MRGVGAPQCRWPQTLARCLLRPASAAFRGAACSANIFINRIIRLPGFGARACPWRTAHSVHACASAMHTPASHPWAWRARTLNAYVTHCTPTHFTVRPTSSECAAPLSAAPWLATPPREGWQLGAAPHLSLPRWLSVRGQHAAPQCTAVSLRSVPATGRMIIIIIIPPLVH